MKKTWRGHWTIIVFWVDNPTHSCHPNFSTSRLFLDCVSAGVISWVFVSYASGINAGSISGQLAEPWLRVTNTSKASSDSGEVPGKGNSPSRWAAFWQCRNHVLSFLSCAKNRFFLYHSPLPPPLTKHHWFTYAPREVKHPLTHTQHLSSSTSTEYSLSSTITTSSSMCEDSGSSDNTLICLSNKRRDWTTN